ncbi:U5 small nuclear ribonucleoprotein 40 kDa protein [Caenorhabditis elegans]|uniref:U5 small nuclear ribonucleoprotein 40 kDa protein n=1 Tax=Caenorhabditis elegans TaxID=6239 RepID=Q19211_CAEEL|nr:WD_REPEATS_REGION domain-containing protein [Caenorhabditis elegans]CAA91460.1 WD_REPEATS_REGION domain-containing protein [Caenorhabditis elegans]|eukprot:NP_509886.1 Small Nuclear RibonucleoProtein homolog [Caenorhabditis elegans]
MALVTSSGQQLVSSGFPQQTAQRFSNLMAPTMVLLGHEGEIYTGAFSPDGTCLATSGYDQKIFFWNVYGECENFSTIKGHSGAVMDLKFTTDSSSLVSCGTDKSVRVWDMETGTCARRFRTHTDFVNAVHPSRRGVTLVASASDDGTCRVHDMRTKEPVKTYTNRYQQTAVTFNDSSDQVISGGIDNVLKVWDMRRDEITYTLTGHRDTITGISLSPSGKFIISNSMDCTVRQWDIRPFVPGQRSVGVFAGHNHNFEKNLLKCSWSPCERFITAGSSDRFLYVWETLSKKIVYKLPGHMGSVNCTDFHPKEPIMLSCGSDKRVFLGEIDMS